MSILDRIRNLRAYPSWAEKRGDFVVVDVDVAYPLYLAALQDADPKVFRRPDRYTAEVCRRVLTNQLLIRHGRPLRLRLVSPGGAWKLKNLPESDVIKGRPSDALGAEDWRLWAPKCRSLV